MIDMHVHLERGQYTKEWLMEFVKYAQQRNIDKLCLLEHSHRFIEFRDIYDSIVSDDGYGKYQRDWLARRSELHLSEYKQFIDEMRGLDFPIDINFGLEICYFPNKEEKIKECISDFDWDFVTGSVHWIDSWGFDHPKTKDSWEKQDIDRIYIRYYELMIKLVESKIFNVLAHPDSIKCFNYYPSIDLSHIYKELSLALKDSKMKVEFSNGLYINYKHKELGLNRKLLRVFLENEVEIVMASDAHRPEDVGKYIKKGTDIIMSYRKRLGFVE